VKPERLEAIMAATLENREGAVRKLGNLRFGVLHSGDDPTRLVLVEVYLDAEPAAVHKTTAHYLVWRDQDRPAAGPPRAARISPERELPPCHGMIRGAC
jgi:quinol monooxygenase YgiN